MSVCAMGGVLARLRRQILGTTCRHPPTIMPVTSTNNTGVDPRSSAAPSCGGAITVLGGRMGRIGRWNPARVPMMEIEEEAHNQRDQDKRRPAIFRAGEYDQIVEAADKQRHTRHDGVAEGRAESNHQEHDSGSRDGAPDAAMFDREEKVAQHRDDPNQCDQIVHVAFGIEKKEVIHQNRSMTIFPLVLPVSIRR